MTCHEFQNQQAAYLTGTLSNDAALAIEAHAAECEACGAALEQATRLSSLHFAPPIPAELRTRTLSAVRAQKASRRGPRVWGGVLALAAVAALTFMVVRPSATPEQGVFADTTVAMNAMLDTMTVDGLVEARAQPEFTALDAAAAELQAALNATPDDAELQSFLASVKARRDELSRRVKDARS